ncbi:penicillin acylase family protein [Vibrio ziniensis]|uniref:Penicillin acylase family protein n=1 Tax=Vibrio ziniensis TaxID=2711221 RepID=A0A6G7CL35_9VIBR|nr:penicillin acylase family protein [Vibrio ziniensis]QIH42758.1 penicillin acylase family protein [Vibrio ziniensis]
MLKKNLDTVKISWTENDIPHIEAGNYQSLGFGYGYVHARDRLAEISAQAIVLRGERSKYYGAEQFSTIGFLKTTNLNSDLMFRLRMPVEWAKEELANLSDDARAYVVGYVNGLNHFVQSLTEEEWHERNSAEPLITFEAEDVIRSAMRFGIMKELIEIGPYLVASSGAWRADLASNHHTCHSEEVIVEGGFGSNAWAFGGDVIEGEGAILLGNPHSAWQRTPHQQRIYMHQYHLTIPGELDVAGTSFLGFPLPLTGYNADVSWSILDAATVTSFVLQLMDIQETELNPTYLMDGKLKPLEIKEINIDVLEDNGEIETRRYHFLHSELGFLFKLPQRQGKPEGWYAITNPGERNARGIDQFLAAAKTHTTSEFVQSIESNRGILCQLIVADRHGDIAYVMAGNVPPITDEQMAACHIGDHAAAFNVLDGTRSVCSFRDENRRPLTAPTSFYPNVFSRGIIHNANNSYKYTEYGVCQPDFPSVFGQHKPEHQIAKSIAARLSYDPRLAMSAIRMKELSQAPFITPSNALEVLFDNRNYAAETFLQDILSHLQPSSSLSIQAASKVLAKWDRKNNSDSRGALLFHLFWNKVVQLNLLSVPSSGDPELGTQLNLTVDCVEQIQQALEETVAELQQFEFELDKAWGDVLCKTENGETIQLHGGSYLEGILNGEMPAPLEKSGFPYILFGTAYIQLSRWENSEIVVEGLLSHGQRDAVASEGRTRQLKMFSNKTLGVIPFLPQQLKLSELDSLTLSRQVLES